MNGKNLLIDLSHIDRKFIEESENDTICTKNSTHKEPAQGRKVFRKPLLIAAIVALMLFLMGCAAVILLHLDDLRVGEEEYVANMQYQEDGSKIPATEKTKHFICVVGAEGSKNQQALLEWLEFAETYDPAQYSEGEYQKPEIYCDYAIYNQEMEDFLKALLDKYGLKPTGNAEIIQAYREYDEELFHELLGIQGVVAEKTNISLDFGGCRFNECGNFNASYNAVLDDSEFMLIYNYHNKDYFGKDYFIIEDADTAQQWNYTCQDGTEVLIVNEKGEDTHILCDREDAFISVTVRNVGPNWDSPGDVMTQQELEQIADSMDYTILPHAVSDMETASERIAQSREAYKNQDWSAQEAEQVQEYEENEHHASYAELIICMRDNEEYFTSKKNAGYENFWETMEYTLRDVTGDGEDELLLGKNNNIYAIWTIQDGVTDHLEGGYPEGYLCEGNVMEHYSFLDGQPFHFYRQLTNDGDSKKILDVEYCRAEGTWILDDGSGREEISEEKAMEIIARFPRIEIDMKPVKEFPMN